MIYGTLLPCIDYSSGIAPVARLDHFCPGSRRIWDMSTCWARNGIFKPHLKPSPLPRAGFDATWVSTPRLLETTRSHV
jgi:hypothetical protein